MIDWKIHFTVFRGRDLCCVCLGLSNSSAFSVSPELQGGYLFISIRMGLSENYRFSPPLLCFSTPNFSSICDEVDTTTCFRQHANISVIQWLQNDDALDEFVCKGQESSNSYSHVLINVVLHFDSCKAWALISVVRSDLTIRWRFRHLSFIKHEKMYIWKTREIIIIIWMTSCVFLYYDLVPQQRRLITTTTTAAFDIWHFHDKRSLKRFCGWLAWQIPTIITDTHDYYDVS